MRQPQRLSRFGVRFLARGTCRTIGSEDGGHMAAASATIRVLGCAALCVWAVPGSAQQSDGPVKSVAKALGFATDVGPPADFVVKSRPKGRAGLYSGLPAAARTVSSADERQGVRSAPGRFRFGREASRRRGARPIPRPPERSPRKGRRAPGRNRRPRTPRNSKRVCPARPADAIRPSRRDARASGAKSRDLLRR